MSKHDLLSFIQQVKYVKPEFVNLNENQDHPRIMYYSNDFLNHYESFGFLQQRKKIKPFPIPELLKRFLKKYEDMYNINFQSVTIEHYEKDKQYDNYWSDLHSKYLLSFYIHEDKKSPIEIEFQSKELNKNVTKTLKSFQSIFKNPKHNKLWSEHVKTTGCYVIHFHNDIFKKKSTQYLSNFNKKNELFKERIYYNDMISEQLKYPNYINCNELNFNDIKEELQSNNIYIYKNIGKGSWGEVYSIKVNKNMNCALKVSKVDKEDDIFILRGTYNKKDVKWHEQYLLENILNYNQTCPNLPLYINSFFSKSHTFNLYGEKEKEYPAIINTMELAHGDLKKFLNVKKHVSNEMITSILFQILSGIHYMHKNAQNVNRDIKPSNILFYIVNKGGYWKYKIGNKEYSVPNTGIVVLLTDFGVSRSYSPSLQLSNGDKLKLGLRCGLLDEKKNVFLPFYHKEKSKNTQIWVEKTINPSYFLKPSVNMKTNEFNINLKDLDELRLSRRQKNLLEKHNLSLLSLDSYNECQLLPPFEFYSDIQNVVRMFCNFKKEQCDQRKKNKVICVSNLCNNCMDGKIDVKKIKSCKTCSVVCKKCNLSLRLCQQSFFENYNSIPHDYVRSFVKPILMKNSFYNKTIFSIESKYILAEKTIESLFSDIYSCKKKKSSKYLEVYEF